MSVKVVPLFPAPVPSVRRVAVAADQPAVHRRIIVCFLRCYQFFNRRAVLRTEATFTIIVYPVVPPTDESRLPASAGAGGDSSVRPPPPRTAWALQLVRRDAASFDGI